MASNGITSSKDFDAYYAAILSRRESQNLNIVGFEQWDTPQIDFTYDLLEAEQKISVMATVLDLNSEPIPLGSKGFRTLNGSIPRQKARWQRGENDYRKELITLQNLQVRGAFLNESPEASIQNYLTELLFGGLSEIQDAHIGRLSYMVGQMKSEGAFSLTAENNGRGIQNISFTAHIPTSNIITLSGDARWFTDDDKATEGTSSDPVSDLRKLVRDARDKYNGLPVTVEVNETSFFEDMKHSKWLVALGYAISPDIIKYAGVSAEAQSTAAAVAAASTDDEIKNAFRRVIGADEVIFNKTVSGVETYDKTSKKLVVSTLPAFSKNRYLVRPSGSVGIIKNVVPLRPDGSAISARIFDSHGIIEYRYDATTKVQDWVSELTALPVPTQPSTLYILKTK